MRRYKFTFLAITASFFGVISQAQVVNGPDTTINKQQQLQPVEVRGLRATTDAPFAKTNISGKDIEKVNLGQDLPILLQYTPSAVVTSDAGTGIGYTGIRIRGTDPTRINVTMNGIPVNDPEESQTFFVDIPDIASSIGSIQIQRGAGTSTNGAGAFGATISISNLQQLDSAGAIFNSSYGSFNTFKNTLQAGTGMLKGGWQFDVRLSKISSDGYIQRGTSDLKSLQFTAGWKASEKTWFHFMVMTGTEKTGQAWDGVPQDSLKTNRTYNELGLKTDGTFYNNQTDNYQQDYYQLFVDHNFNHFLTAHVGLFLTRGKGYYEEYVDTDLYSNYGVTNAPYDSTNLIKQLWLNNYYYGSVFSLLYQKHKTELSFGGGWTQFENLHYGYVTWAQNGGFPDNYKWYQDDAQKNDLNLYIKAQQTIGKSLVLYGDIQYRNIAYFINGFDDNLTLRPDVNYNFFNPKAGITYLLKNTAREKQKLYASVAVANKEPNRDDFEVDPQHLPKPEILYDAEAGYEISKLRWNLGANLYYVRYHDQLVLTGQINDVGVYTQTNVPNSYRAGIELQGATAPLRWLKILANATFSRNKVDDFSEYLYDNEGNPYVYHYKTTDISFSPNVISAGTIAFTPFHNLPKSQNVEIDITEKYVGKQYLDNTNDNDRAISAYNYCNVLLRYSIKMRPFKELDATLQLNNIFNQFYNSNGFTYPSVYGGVVSNYNYYFPQAGFNVLGGITIKW
ncbi:MAG TPA: TonB-dependent receptor plug domain-containing protein [Flavipsychrobacter sp.]|nr:TonB-dependent receptor plug domain-containing protein [Flavipsychrobacter sp.]